MGPPGAGKSLYAVMRMIRAVRAGRAVYSNLYPRWSSTWRWGNWDTMREAGEGLFVVDEAQMWFNSREFAGNTAELGSWQQSRKRGADLVWVAQHVNRVDVAIRELTTVIWRPRIIGPFLVARGETPEGDAAGFDIGVARYYRGAYYTDQVIGGRSDRAARLARVVPAVYIEPDLEVQSPSHMWVDGGTRLVPYVAGVPAMAYLYRDYEGRWLEVDEQFRVTGVVASPEHSLVRALRRAVMDRRLRRETLRRAAEDLAF